MSNSQYPQKNLFENKICLHLKIILKPLTNPVIGTGEAKFSSYVHTHTQKIMFLYVAII